MNIHIKDVFGNNLCGSTSNVNVNFSNQAQASCEKCRQIIKNSRNGILRIRQLVRRESIIQKFLKENKMISEVSRNKLLRLTEKLQEDREKFYPKTSSEAFVMSQVPYSGEV